MQVSANRAYWQKSLPDSCVSFILRWRIHKPFNFIVVRYHACSDFDRVNSSIVIARRGVERGKFLAPDGAEADAIHNHFIRLQNRYAHVIHEYIVKMD